MNPPVDDDKPMKSLPVLTLSLAFAASFPASAISLMFDFGNPTANTAVPETNTSSPGPVASGNYLTLSPGHVTGDVATGETTWNTITTSGQRSDLSYSNGTSATGVTLTLGQEAVAGDNTINFSTAISTLNLLGNGGGTAGRQSLLTAGSIYGDSRLGSSAVGRDGFFGGAGSAIGFRVDGLAAGRYIIYLMGRNTNSNTATTLGGMTFYATNGPSSSTFANFNSATSGLELNTTYATTGYAGQYGSFVAGENYVALNVTIAAGESLFVAVDGTQQELRGFLNMAQIAPAPTPFAWSKGDGDWDTSSFNWNTDSETYSEPSRVTFPTLTDAGDGINTVNLTGGVSPNGVNITNTGDTCGRVDCDSKTGGRSTGIGEVVCFIELRSRETTTRAQLSTAFAQQTIASQPISLRQIRCGKHAWRDRLVGTARAGCYGNWDDLAPIRESKVQIKIDLRSAGE